MTDSSSAAFWLPESVCTRFEEVLGLQWDQIANLYFVSEALHQSLSQQKPSITLTFGHEDNTINITFPYAAFDTTARWPLVTTDDKRYFPLRRSATDEYVLGRTFFQEAYVTADYERRNFSIAQAVHDRNVQLKAIASVSSPSRDYDSSLSTGAIVGIVLGSVAVLAPIAGLIWWFTRRTQKQPEISHPFQSNLNHASSRPELLPCPVFSEDRPRSHGEKELFRGHSNTLPEPADMEAAAVSEPVSALSNTTEDYNATRAVRATSIELPGDATFGPLSRCPPEQFSPPPNFSPLTDNEATEQVDLVERHEIMDSAARSKSSLHELA
jgi:hypothetical protein